MATKIEKRHDSGASVRSGTATYGGRRSHEPAYLHIANAIADQIGAGVYRAGDQLPTEPQLRESSA